MDFALTADQQAICEQIERLCAPFDDHYWFERDHDGAFPLDFVKAMADGGWLGIAMPEAYGGAGLGITEAALMMQTIAASGHGLRQLRHRIETLGGRLFAPAGRGIALTELGHTVFGYAQEIFRLGSELQAAVTGRSTG